MKQRRCRPACATAASIFAGLLLIGCGHRQTPAAQPAATLPAAIRPTIASLVPAVSNLLVDLGLADHLAAVSNYDVETPATRGRPRAGDYLSIDWELLGQLRPNTIVVEIDPARLPPGLVDRAPDIGAKLVNVRLRTLADISIAATTLATAAGDANKATAANAAFQAKLAAITARVQSQPPVPTLLLLDDRGQSVVGPGGFLDEVLQTAGGTNVAASYGKPYLTLDAEAVAALKPRAIIALMPGASPERASAASIKLRVLANGAAKVWIATNPADLMPAYTIADLASRMAAFLHGNP